jgi:cytochrome c-type biogenesis protein CcmE
VPHRKFLLPAIGVLAVVVIVLISINLGDSLTFYLTPSEAVARRAEFSEGRRFRLGGLVTPGSLTEAGGVRSFSVTDGAATVPVRLTGAAPPLFAEDVGVVVEGTWSGDQFAADVALIRHDETYKPPEGYQAPAG